MTFPLFRLPRYRKSVGDGNGPSGTRSLESGCGLAPPLLPPIWTRRALAEVDITSVKKRGSICITLKVDPSRSYSVFV